MEPNGNLVVTHNLPDGRILVQIYRQFPGASLGIRHVNPESYINDELIGTSWIRYDLYRITYVINHGLPNQEILTKDIIKWFDFNNKDSSTFPPEGETVLVSDGINYDTAWYVMSSEYKWLKSDLIQDESYDFNQFEIKKWKLIDV